VSSTIDQTLTAAIDAAIVGYPLYCPTCMVMRSHMILGPDMDSAQQPRPVLWLCTSEHTQSLTLDQSLRLLNVGEQFVLMVAQAVALAPSTRAEIQDDLDELYGG